MERRIGYDCSPDWEPFDRRIAENVARYARPIVWANLHELSSSGFGLLPPDPERTGLCHVINAVGASALRRLVGDGVGVQVHPVVARWAILSPEGEVIGVSSWGDKPSYLDGKFHVAVACVDRSKVYEENGVLMLPVAYVDFAVGDIVRMFAAKDSPNRLAVSGDVFCSWDNRGREEPLAVYIPPQDILESGPFLEDLLSQDADTIEELAEMVVREVRRAGRPLWRRLLGV